MCNQWIYALKYLNFKYILVIHSICLPCWYIGFIQIWKYFEAKMVFLAQDIFYVTANFFVTKSSKTLQKPSKGQDCDVLEFDLWWLLLLGF